MADVAQEAQTALRSALKETTVSWLVSPEVRAQIITLAHAGLTSAQKAAQRMAAWIERTQATRIISADLVSLPDFMQRYFAGEPPFAAVGSKKHEFPDAFALLALEAWAADHGTRVLVVSDDGDWRRYCAQSQRLVLRDDLAAVLGAFQQPTARYATRRIGELLGEGDPIGLEAAIVAALEAQDGQVWFDVDASSTYHVEHDVSEPEFLGVTLPSPDTAVLLFDAVDFTDGILVVHVHFTADARVRSHFRFKMWEGVDREYLPMGSGTVETDETIDMEALVSLGGEIPEHMEIRDVEILPCTHRIELDNISPDWLGGHDDYDADDDKR